MEIFLTFFDGLNVGSSIAVKGNVVSSMNNNQSVEVNVKHTQSNAVPATDDHTTNNQDMEKAVFERIKENDQKQWKNSETNQGESLADDY